MTPVRFSWLTMRWRIWLLKCFLSGFILLTVYQSALNFFGDICHLGATSAVQEILEDTQQHPPGVDEHTHILLEEVARIFIKTLDDVISNSVVTNDF